MRHLPFWPTTERWPTVYGRATVSCMDVMDGRPVLVPAGLLDDLLENVRLAVESGAVTDPRVADALRAGAAEVRTRSLMEP